jgi:hypothetical protein
MNNKTEYQSVNNRPIGCHFCGAQVQGRVTESKDPKTNQLSQDCRWVCGRCGNLVKVGKIK